MKTGDYRQGAESRYKDRQTRIGLRNKEEEQEILKREMGM
jgi:hypothetical protein